MTMHVTRSASSFRSLFDPPVWSIFCDIRQWYSNRVQQKPITQTVDGIVQRFVFEARRVESTHNAIETYRGFPCVCYPQPASRLFAYRTVRSWHGDSTLPVQLQSCLDALVYSISSQHVRAS
jgi:hypothetical protein